ncbi:hypothetical protein [Ammoniphilus resinae]|uniref:Uncharacterized protein n=1 Tax=Ammoniphilus resinae TaxID=861532 RepID=A0ABS4GNY2_9BACL|nr:hypothetical protein [Ammoniphilus resinae]MBP1931978.1 hypothetical protein [Ammoniphilus resinae]
MLENVVSTLLSSPMFNLSLSSKELFHSNFLSWVFSLYKDESLPYLRQFIADFDQRYSLVRIKREKKNKDLTLYFEDDRGRSKVLYIENKVKSIPVFAQLKEYSQGSMAHEYFLLLSLSRPSFFNEGQLNIGNVTWKYLSYGELADNLQNLSLVIRKKNLYHANILEDYISFIGCLHQIAVEIDIQKDTYNLYTKNSILPQLKQLRLHDFYIKHKHAMLANAFFQAIGNRIPDINLVPPKKHWEEGKYQEVFVGTGYTNGKGLSEVKYVIDMEDNYPVILGIQVQGDQFRLFLEAKKRAAFLANELLDKGLWFNFLEAKQVNTFGSLEYPTNKGKKFNTYSGTFMYRAIKIGNCRFDHLVDLIVTYIRYIHNHREQLEDFIKTRQLAQHSSF